MQELDSLPQTASQLLPLVYEELRRLAAHQLAREPAGQTLQPTALVHEAYLRVVGRPAPPDGAATGADVRGGDPPDEPRRPRSPAFANRAHFFAAAAEAMRRILIDNARRKHGPRRGGGRRRRVAAGDDLAAPTPGPSPDELLALDEALDRLAREAPRQAELVKLRYFAGLTMPEAAAVLGVSLATAERHWVYARTWLFAELNDAPSPEENPRPV